MLFGILCRHPKRRLTATVLQPTLKLNPLNAELNPICHILALLGAHHILHVRRIRVNLKICRYFTSHINAVSQSDSQTRKRIKFTSDIQEKIIALLNTQKLFPRNITIGIEILKSLECNFVLFVGSYFSSLNIACVKQPA